MPRFATIELSRTSARRAAANDNSPHSIYAYTCEVEDLLRRLHAGGDPAFDIGAARDRFRRRVATAIIAIALVTVYIPACADAIAFLKSQHEDIDPPAEDPVVWKGDRLDQPAPIAGSSTLTEDDVDLSARSRSEAASPALIRGTIADNRPASAVAVPPPPRKPLRKRTADRTSQFARPANIAAPAAPPPPSLLDTMFSLRTLFSQSQPQT